jgi:hypothetical protein
VLEQRFQVQTHNFICSIISWNLILIILIDPDPLWYMWPGVHIWTALPGLARTPGAPQRTSWVDWRRSPSTWRLLSASNMQILSRGRFKTYSIACRIMIGSEGNVGDNGLARRLRIIPRELDFKIN